MKISTTTLASLFVAGFGGIIGAEDALASDHGRRGVSGQVASVPALTAGGDLVARGREFQLAGKADVAHQFHRQALLPGNPEGAFQSGCLGSSAAERLGGRLKLLKESAALDDFYRAATNGHAGACLKISDAFRGGRGTPASLPQAYLWLKLARDRNPAVTIKQLDELAVQLTASELKEAQFQAPLYLAGSWPRSVAPVLREGDPRLKINGLSTGARSTVMINGVTFRQGETASVAPLLRNGPAGGKPEIQTQAIQISCSAIGSDYVLVMIAGEPDLRLLALGIN